MRAPRRRSASPRAAGLPAPLGTPGLDVPRLDVPEDELRPRHGRRAGLRRRWRATGADLPRGDPLPAHPAPMEGYLWRFTDPVNGRVLLLACGVNHHPRRPWTTVVAAAHPGSLVRSTSVEGTGADTSAYRIAAHPALELTHDRLRARVGDEVDLRCALRPFHTWPPRRFLHGSGVFSLFPGLDHYWHPHLFGAAVEGTVRLRDHTWDLTGCQVYAEKSWGRGFPRAWWWGQAHGFDRQDLCVAFAGGLLGRGRLTVPVSGLVVAIGGRTVSLVPPGAWVRATVGDGSWHVRGHSPRYQVEMTGTAEGERPLRLPVPLLDPYRYSHSLQHLSGRLRVRVRRDGRLLYAGTSRLAGLETGGV
ncbi:tocopherol cyclase family protein [Streptomyces diacarni]|uniref:tocopherol cyclase family protein n=1 Tax=Streptomyces diacarni TaxID=2800381 RepID=UPI0033D18C86